MDKAYLDLGYSCNQNCLNCQDEVLDRLRFKVDREVIFDCVEAIERCKRCVQVVISGGEPTLSPYFFEVLDRVAKSGHYITILSNVLKCSDREYVRKITNCFRGYNMDRLRFITTIHTVHPPIHDRVTGVAGSYLKTMRGLKNLDEEGVNVTIRHLLNRVTVRSLGETLKFLSNYFSERVSFQLKVTNYVGKSKRNIQYLYMSNEEMGEYLEKVLDYLEMGKDTRDRKLEIVETPYCLLDGYYWEYYVMDDRYGVEERKIIDSRYGNGVLRGQTCYRECQGCEKRNRCFGVLETTYNMEQGKNKVLRKIR